MDKKYLQKHYKEQVFFVKENIIRKRTKDDFQKIYDFLVKILPGRDIQHVGATSIPGSLTKGDIDIQIRVNKEEFKETKRLLEKHFKIDSENPPTKDYVSFKNTKSKIPMAIQLTIKNTKFDDFYKIRDILINNKKLLKEYNEIKKRHHGKSMNEYRTEKEKFFEKILR